MTFAKKDFLKQEKKLKSLYSGLECCNARFQLSFDESFGLGPSVGSSKILQCSAIGEACSCWFLISILTKGFSGFFMA